MTSLPTTQEDDILSSTQKEAIKYIKKIAKENSDNAYPILKKRFLKLGYSEDDLEKVISYIRDEAPIIIHFHAIHVEKYLKDEYYRNLFETKCGHGTLNENLRKEWEDRLFNKLYTSSSGFERVKYGCLNFTNCKEGVSLARQYGRCYFILKQHVRKRVSITNGDSSSYTTLGCVDYYCHLLNEFHDWELDGLVEVATKKKEYGRSHDSFISYKEVQVHGPIRFKYDIAAMVVHQEDYQKPVVKEFSEINNIPIIVLP